MSEVNLNLKFQATNADVVSTIADKIEKIDEIVSRKFKLQLDTENFTKSLTDLANSLKGTTLNKTFVTNMENLVKILNNINIGNLGNKELEGFIKNINSLNLTDLNKTVIALNSLAPVLDKFKNMKTPNLNSFMNGISKMEKMDINVSNIEKFIETINSFKAVTLQINGVKDLQSLLRILKNFNESGLDETVVKKLNSIGKALNKINVNMNISGMKDLSSMINRIKSLNKLELDEKNFLSKMQTLAKGFEELSKAKIDIDKMRSMADAMKSIAEINKGSGGKSDGFGNLGGLASIVTTYLSLSSLKNAVDESKDLEYAILQVGVAGELTSQQMKELKQSMFEMSSQSGKSAVEITNAMDAIIKTGQTLENAKLILDTALKTSVAAGEVLPLNI